MMCLNKWKVIDFNMADIGVFLEKYSKYQTTFKVTSYDDNNKEHICLDELNQNINFDEIIADIYPNSKEYRPKSFDSIYIHENIIYCILLSNYKRQAILCRYGKFDTKEIQFLFSSESVPKNKIIHFDIFNLIDVSSHNLMVFCFCSFIFAAIL